jgi:hypothetical protein
LRFTAGDVLQNPDSITTQVRAILSGRPISSAGAGPHVLATGSRPAGAGTRGRRAPAAHPPR